MVAESCSPFLWCLHVHTQCRLLCLSMPEIRGSLGAFQPLPLLSLGTRSVPLCVSLCREHSHRYHAQACFTQSLDWLTFVTAVYCAESVLYFLGLGTVERGVLRHSTVYHAPTQAQVCNTDMTI